MPTTPEHLLTDGAELLHRQVNPGPSFLREGRPSSAAFRPTPKDGGELSVSRGSKRSAAAAFEAFVSKGWKSAGVWSVSVAEVESAGLHAYADEKPEDDAHAVIDFRPLPKKADIDRAADKLKRAAIERKQQEALTAASPEVTASVPDTGPEHASSVVVPAPKQKVLAEHRPVASEPTE